MNINDVKDLKQYYEKTIVTELAKAIGINEDMVTANWTLENTTVNIMLNQENTITSFTFDYDGTEFIIHTSAYSIIANQNVPIGIVNESATISLNTIQLIFDTIVDTLTKSINEDKGDSDVN